MQRNRGFTLIELVMVIAIIGILAAIALPKFIDLSRSAKEGAAKGGLGAIRSALAINYAQSATGGATASYTSAITAGMFSDSLIPANVFIASTTANRIVTTTASVPTAFVQTTAAWWYITSTGQAGAWVDSTASNPTNW